MDNKIAGDSSPHPYTVTILIEGSTYPRYIHKDILGSNSSKLSDKIDKLIKNQQPLVINFPNGDFDIFDTIESFFYHKGIPKIFRPLNSKEAMKVGRFAIEWEIPLLGLDVLECFDSSLDPTFLAELWEIFQQGDGLQKSFVTKTADFHMPERLVGPIPQNLLQQLFLEMSSRASKLKAQKRARTHSRSSEGRKLPRLSNESKGSPLKGGFNLEDSELAELFDGGNTDPSTININTPIDLENICWDDCH
ncbi:hypothetical protein F5884DRAFT_757704 [Xylogone sp. PMI_703]|nr:hypothetical protein F5884DRAFT_757704 [Xylogone sp. PMI_703]